MSDPSEGNFDFNKSVAICESLPARLKLCDQAVPALLLKAEIPTMSAIHAANTIQRRR
jgi:hypothetical protein